MVFYSRGNGIARDKYLSAYVELLPSNDNDIPTRPFRGVITFVVIDQSGKANHQSKSIKACFQKYQPKANQAYGISELLPLDILKNQSTLLVKDQLIIGVAIRYNQNV